MIERPRDHGFTMIELVVVVLLIGVVATAIVAVVAVIARADGPVSSTADDSRTLHGLTIWLPRDVSAVAPSGFDFSPATTTGCTGASPGTNLVHLSWAETAGSTTNFIANYRFVDVPPGRRIERFACSGSGAGPYGNRTTLNLTGDLSVTPPIVTPILDGAAVVGVAIEAYSSAGDPLRVEAGTRNRAESLPATTTTTLATGSCVLVGSPGVSASPNPVSNIGPGPTELQAPVTVNIQVAGSCSSLDLIYDRGDGAGQQTTPFTGGPTDYAVVLAADVAQPWSDGDHPLYVYDGATGPLGPILYLLQVT